MYLPDLTFRVRQVIAVRLALGSIRIGLEI